MGNFSAWIALRSCRLYRLIGHCTRIIHYAPRQTWRNNYIFIYPSAGRNYFMIYGGITRRSEYWCIHDSIERVGDDAFWRRLV